MNIPDVLYPNNDNLHVRLEPAILEAAKEQQRDNRLAEKARIQSVGLQVTNNPELRNDLVAILVGRFVSPSTFADAFGIDGHKLMQIVEAEPIFVFDCVMCKDPLPTDTRPGLVQRQRAQSVLCKIEAGELVEAELLSKLLCEACTQGLAEGHSQQRRAELCARKARLKELSQMPYPKYLQTPEWKALRKRALTRSGNRCQLCSSTQKLNVHHNCYDRRGNELLEDLTVLCRRCHEVHHGELPGAA